MTIQEMFDKFTRPEFFSRVDNSHILELHIGIMQLKGVAGTTPRTRRVDSEIAKHRATSHKFQKEQRSAFAPIPYLYGRAALRHRSGSLRRA